MATIVICVRPELNPVICIEAQAIIDIQGKILRYIVPDIVKIRIFHHAEILIGNLAALILRQIIPSSDFISTPPAHRGFRHAALLPLLPRYEILPFLDNLIGHILIDHKLLESKGIECPAAEIEPRGQAESNHEHGEVDIEAIGNDFQYIHMPHDPRVPSL